MNDNSIKNLIIKAYKETLPEFSNEKLDNDTPLVGDKSKLDSLGLVGLLITVEQKLEDQLNISLTIADEKAMSLKNSPFKTIETLSNYLELRIDEIQKK
ncbi:MAG: hypothetical protein CMM99_05960 [Rickettsiales bacterium]|nr:hypothetical protein [Rickettsiales bacterium]